MKGTYERLDEAQIEALFFEWDAWNRTNDRLTQFTIGCINDDGTFDVTISEYVPRRRKKVAA